MNVSVSAKKKVCYNPNVDIWAQNLGLALAPFDLVFGRVFGIGFGNGAIQCGGIQPACSTRPAIPRPTPLYSCNLIQFHFNPSQHICIDVNTTISK